MRNQIAPLKCMSDQWLEVMAIGHELGLNSSATMMFGHVETLDDRLEHLQRLRDQQDATGGFTAFICWTFQPGRNRAGSIDAARRATARQRGVSAHAGAQPHFPR